MSEEPTVFFFPAHGKVVDLTKARGVVRAPKADEAVDEYPQLIDSSIGQVLDTTANGDGPMVGTVAASLHADIRDAILQEVQALPEVWQKLSESNQREVCDRVDQMVDAMLPKAVNVILGEEFPVIEGTLDSFTVKKEAKGVILFDRKDPGILDLVVSTQAPVKVALTDTARFRQTTGSIQPEPDQPELVLESGQESAPTVPDEDRWILSNIVKCEDDQRMVTLVYIAEPDDVEAEPDERRINIKLGDETMAKTFGLDMTVGKDVVTYVLPNEKVCTFPRPEDGEFDPDPDDGTTD